MQQVANIFRRASVTKNKETFVVVGILIFISIAIVALSVTVPILDNAIASSGAFIAAIVASLLLLATIAEIQLNQEQLNLLSKQTVESKKPVLIVGGKAVLNDRFPSIDFEQSRNFEIRNIGDGPAFNILATIFGTEYLMWDGKKLDQTSSPSYFTHYFNSPLPEKESILDTFTVGGATFLDKVVTTKKGCYSFFAPGGLRSDGYHAARVIITCHDMFGNKYVSIFDYIQNIGWKMITIEEVEKDLYDLESSNLLLIGPNQTSS